jgi:hypothetical protein
MRGLRVRAHAALIASALLAASCGDHAAAADGGTDAGPQRCTRRRQCTGGGLCISDGVAELVFEPGEEGSCGPPAAALGHDAPRWQLRTGGPALAARLCTAQGLSPGEASPSRRGELLRQTGVSVVRLDFRWDQLEPAPGAFAWDAHDAMVSAAEAQGLEVLGILGYGVPWASAATDGSVFYPPDDPADFARFVGAVAARYAGRIRRWEIWNEQNAGYRFWLPNLHGDSAAYAGLLRAAATAVHASCADCEVLSGGLFFHEQIINGALEFTSDMLDADPTVLDEVDAFAFHPYPLYPPQAPPDADELPQRSIFAMTHDLRALLARRGVRDLPLAVTEFGWPSYATVDEDEQARFLTRAVLVSAAMGLDPICWFNVTDGPLHGTSPPEDDFGLYRFGSEDDASPIDPKPARDAMAWLARIGADAVLVGEADDPRLHAPAEGRFALDFERPDGTWRALWSLQPYDIDLPGETRVGRDLLGREVLVTASRFSIGPSPLFLVPSGLGL